MDYKSVQFAIAIYVLQSFCVFYVFDKHIISHGRSIVADLLICPNPALNYCRKLLMSFAV